MSATRRTTPDCRVCAGAEPSTVVRLLLLGRSPRRIAPVFGHTRRAVAKHRDLCLVGERRAAAEEGLREMAGVEEGGGRRG